MKEKKFDTRTLVECAVMVAAATVLSLIKIDLPLGGGVTLCSMLPIAVAAYRHGVKWGLGTAFVYSVLQMMLGLDNVRYATSALMAAGIIVFDYIAAYTVIGFAGIFRDKMATPGRELATGVVVTFFVRFLCHFLTGWVIWEQLWPNEFGMAAPLWSLVYNGSYMAVETVLSAIAGAVLAKHLTKTQIDS